jgi:hypothetical protein
MKVLYKFENSGYRTGYYPLWNWLIDFEKSTINKTKNDN